MKHMLSLWDPFRELTDMSRRFGGLLGTEAGALGALGASEWQPAVDVEENKDAWLITADLPEVKKEDVRVTVRDGVITLSGERTREIKEDDKDRKFHRVERSYGRYERSFRLPEGVDPAEVTADFTDGVLKVRMPKGKAKEPETRLIDVK